MDNEFMDNENIVDLNDFFRITQNIFKEILKDDNWFLDKALQISAQEAWKDLEPKFNKLKDEVATTKTGEYERSSWSIWRAIKI